MTDSTRQHLIRYPHARTSTVIYLRKRDEKTEQLRQEIGMQQILQEQQIRSPVPWWRRALSALRGQSVSAGDMR